MTDRLTPALLEGVLKEAVAGFIHEHCGQMTSGDMQTLALFVQERAGGIVEMLRGYGIMAKTTLVPLRTTYTGTLFRIPGVNGAYRKLYDPHLKGSPFVAALRDSVVVARISKDTLVEVLERPNEEEIVKLLNQPPRACEYT